MRQVMRLCSWMLPLVLAVACYVAGSSKALESWLTGAAASGRTHVAVTAPGGEVIARGADLTAAMVEQTIANHAATLPARKKPHAYRLQATTPDGGGLLELTETRAGGVLDEEDVHRVDAERVQNAGQAIGHLVKLVISQGEELRHAAHDARSSASRMARENRRLHRLIMQSEGELGLAYRVLQGEEKEREQKRDMWKPWLDRVLSLGEGVAQRYKMLPPNEQASLVASLKASLTAGQREAIRRIVGEQGWQAIGWASTPEELADVLYDMGEPKVREMLMGAGLEQAQVNRFALTCGPRWKERKAAKDRAASESASSTGHGAQGEPATGTGGTPPPGANSEPCVDPMKQPGAGADSGEVPT